VPECDEKNYIGCNERTHKKIGLRTDPTRKNGIWKKTNKNSKDKNDGND